MEYTSNNNSLEEGCHIKCHMEANERGEFDVVAALRLITSSLSITGALSIVASVVYRKTVCNPKVHPIFVLSIVDTLLSALWISGALVWLKGGVEHHPRLRVGCFTITCMTVILQCVAMNVTLIYALLAYSSIKQRDFSGVYMVQQRPVSFHVWPPLCSFTAYFIAWTLPVSLIVILFGVIAQQYEIVDKAKDCSCWCLPFYGNVLPRPNIGFHNGKQGDKYLLHLHYFIVSYAAVLISNFVIVLSCMAVTYYKIFRRIKRMIVTQENNENTPLYGATRAMILAGQKDAKKRVFLFFSVFFVTGFVISVFGIFTFNIILLKHHNNHTAKIFIFISLIFEALFVPSQGLMNALAYGWTRGDFLSVMSTCRHNRTLSDSVGTSYEGMEEEEEEETEVEDEREDWEKGFHPELPTMTVNCAPCNNQQ
ncbi:hypothetical protein GBAR_LOCUS13152 [Geodia barretti]|uniref:G-protein coupled receptors family 1 profile domain-containing protein n=1 Tax=Geodia barretti TaxID=519541 RepID=A0AA35S2R6_GEOBA|nr:hypothetical protein GBAR_LOCUS13152 [Geodia barretti]